MLYSDSQVMDDGIFLPLLCCLARDWRGGGNGGVVFWQKKRHTLLGVADFRQHCLTLDRLAQCPLLPSNGTPPYHFLKLTTALYLMRITYINVNKYTHTHTL